MSLAGLICYNVADAGAIFGPAQQTACEAYFTGTFESGTLTSQERGLLRDLFKKPLAAKRESWRVLCEAALKEKEKGKKGPVTLSVAYAETIMREIEDMVGRYHSLITKVENTFGARASETLQLFFATEKADCHRFLSELALGAPKLDLQPRAVSSVCRPSNDTDASQQTTATNSADQIYAALATMIERLPPNDSQRLYSCLSLALYHREIFNDRAKATAILSSAFENYRGPPCLISATIAANLARWRQ